MSDELPAASPPAASAGCCDEHRLSLGRRGFLGGLLGAGVVAAVHGGVVTEASYAATGRAPNVLVVLSLRGGADGLSLVVPHGDPEYYRARPVTAIPAERLLARDATFGLHPAFAPLLPLWSSGRLAAVQAVGMQIPNRSHFAAMELVEDADPGSAQRRGWLNRLIGRDAVTTPIQAVQLGTSALPTSLLGPEPVLSARRNEDIKLAGPEDPRWMRAREKAVSRMWRTVGGPLGASAREAIAVSGEYAPVRSQPKRPQNQAAYPDSDLGDALADVARLVRADVGAEVVTVDMDGWDMHANLGTLDWGDMRSSAGDLAAAVAAFFTDLGSLGDRVTLVTISEFGRRVRENASRGLDHGWGNVMLLAGAGVRGGTYYGAWPGLAGQGHEQGELPVTTDYRSVLAEVLRARFDASTAAVFPGFVPERVGVMLGQ